MTTKPPLRCPECLSEDLRATPLRGAGACLSDHLQFVCGTCGRCTCIQPTTAGLYRWNFPFGSREKARLYLRTAQIATEVPCLICEIESARGTPAFRIFAGKPEQQAYLDKHPDVTLADRSTRTGSLEGSPPEPQVRRLSKKEIRTYLREMGEDAK